MQINPPFNGSAPCPMCSGEIRSLSAYAHNMLNRWREGETLPEPKFWVKLDDLCCCAAGDAGFADPARRGQPIDALNSDNADVQAHLGAIRAIVAEYRKHARPTSHETAAPVAAALAPLVETLRRNQPAINKLSEAHFDDERHASGEMNILREQRGYSPDRGGSYNWTVDRAHADASDHGYDIKHQVCGTRLVLHAHFRERIAKDRQFYGKVWCQTCRMSAPWAQFECRVSG